MRMSAAPCLVVVSVLLAVMMMSVYGEGIDTISLISPQNSTMTSADNGSLEFLFSYSGDNASASCTLFVNGDASYTGNASVDTNTTFYANSTIPEGTNQWYVNCTNVTTSQSEIRTLNVDRTGPDMSVASPEPRAYGSYFIDFNVTLSENGSSCVYSLGGDNASLSMLNGTNFHQRNWSVGDGNYSVKFHCNDSSGNMNSTSLNFSVNHNAKKFILIGVDGMQYSHYLDLMNAGQLQGIEMLIGESGWNGSANITGHYTTATAPGNAEIHTGINENITNITDNTPYKAIPPGNTTFERIKAFNPGIATGLVYGKTTTYIPDSILANAKNGSVDWWHNATTYVNTVWLGGSSCTYGQNVSTKAGEFIENYANTSFYLVVYFGEPDCSGHVYGDESVGYNESFFNVNDSVRVLLDILAENGINDTTQILLTADHGWNENTTGHSIRDPGTVILPLITNNESLVANETTDGIREQCEVAPTILDFFGVNISYYSDITAGGCDSMIGSTECVPDWSCGSWSTCVNSQQSRTCTDLNGCEPDDIQAQSCSSSGRRSSWSSSTQQTRKATVELNLSEPSRIRNTNSLQEGIRNAIGFDIRNDENMEGILRTSESIRPHFRGSREVAAEASRTTVRTVMNYSGKERLENVMIYEVFPKEFAESASEVNVTAPGANVWVIEEDPSWLMVFPDVSEGGSLEVVYEVAGNKDSGITGSIITEVYAQPPEEEPEVVPECTPGHSECSEGLVMVCGQDSEWVVLEYCPNGCDADGVICAELQTMKGGPEDLTDMLIIACVMMLAIIALGIVYARTSWAA